MSNKTLYEIYNDIRNNKDVEKEDLIMAVLTYRDLLWFSNHDIEAIYKANINSISVELRYKQSVERYQLMYDYSMLPKELLKNNFMKGATNE